MDVCGGGGHGLGGWIGNVCPERLLMIKEREMTRVSDVCLV